MFQGTNRFAFLAEPFLPLKLVPGSTKATSQILPAFNCSMSSAHGVFLKENNGNIGKCEMIFVENTLSVIQIFITTKYSNFNITL